MSSLHDLKTGKVVAITDCQIVRYNGTDGISLCSFYVESPDAVVLENRYSLDFDDGQALIVPIRSRAAQGRLQILAIVVDRQERARQVA